VALAYKTWMNDQTPIRRSLAGRLAEAEANPAVRAERKRQWQAENAEAIASSNAWVEEHGLPLGPYRKL
jgi:post-segregation antitoxin (ccd killing protein)